MKRREVGKKINNDEWTKPKWMRQKTFAKLRSQYFDLNEMQDLADFFSLRNIRSAKELLDRYGMAIIAADHFGMKFFGLV